MTEVNYNDGKWHGWNGGKCPVHPMSEVEGMYLDDGKPADLSPCIDKASEFDWMRENAYTLIAFRVVKEYKEPRDVYLKEITQTIVTGETFTRWTDCKADDPGATLFREVL